MREERDGRKRMNRKGGSSEDDEAIKIRWETGEVVRE